MDFDIMEAISKNMPRTIKHAIEYVEFYSNYMETHHGWTDYADGYRAALVELERARKEKPGWASYIKGLADAFSVFDHAANAEWLAKHGGKMLDDDNEEAPDV